MIRLFQLLSMKRVLMAKSAIELLAERNNDGRSALDIALDNYQAWFNASQALAQNKDYEISNGQNSKRKLGRADASEVQEMLNFWENELGRLQGASITGPKIRTIFTVGNGNNEFTR